MSTDASPPAEAGASELPLHAESNAVELREAVRRLASVPMNISLEGWQDISAILLGGAERLARLEREAASEMNSVPRSRYNAANKDWLDERSMRQKQLSRAIAWINLLQTALQELIQNVSNGDAYLTPKFLDKARAALTHTPPEALVDPSPAVLLAAKELVDYLDDNHGLNSVGAESQLHEKLRSALKAVRE